MMRLIKSLALQITLGFFVKFEAAAVEKTRQNKNCVLEKNNLS